MSGEHSSSSTQEMGDAGQVSPAAAGKAEQLKGEVWGERQPAGWGGAGCMFRCLTSCWLLLMVLARGHLWSPMVVKNSLWSGTWSSGHTGNQEKTASMQGEDKSLGREDLGHRVPLLAMCVLLHQGQAPW